MTITRVRRSREDVIFDTLNTVVLTLASLVVLYPLVYVVSASFSSRAAVITGRVWLWPVEPSLEGYRAVFVNNSVLTGYMNSFIYAVVGTTVNVALTIIAAYPLSRRDFKARNILMFVFTFTMIFNGGLIPTYLLVRSLGLINTRAVMIIPNAIGVWHIIVARTYYQSTISTELLEAAKLDGCSDFRFVREVVVPLSKALTAVLTLFYAVHHWNAFFQAFIYLSKEELFPLQIVLRDILIMNQIDASMVVDPEELAAKEGMAELLKYSLIIVASVPVLCLYPFVQRYFVKGVMIGAIKG
jgi:multiple sugar transport system permease protein/putative aldouronate transport system permease protein